LVANGRFDGESFRRVSHRFGKLKALSPSKGKGTKAQRSPRMLVVLTSGGHPWLRAQIRHPVASEMLFSDCAFRAGL
jgi:hypothetical protein